MKPTVFVLGTQRSGSTLLARILSAHPAIYIQNELPLPALFLDDSPYNAIGRRILEHICSRLDSSESEFLQVNKVWGLKDPQLTEYLPKLREFPEDTRFILLVRDPRAVVRSYMENRWGLGTNAFTGAERWAREVSEQLAFYDEFPDRVLLIRYEELVSNLEQSIDKLCIFLRIEPSAGMRDFFKARSPIKPNAQNLNTQRDIDARLAEAWRSQLSAREVALIELVARPLMLRLGYPPECELPTLTALQRRWYRLHQAVVGELQLQYQLRRIAFRRYIQRWTK